MWCGPNYQTHADQTCITRRRHTLLQVQTVANSVTMMPLDNFAVHQRCNSSRVVSQNFVKSTLLEKLVGMYTVQLILIEHQHVQWFLISELGDFHLHTTGLKGNSCLAAPPPCMAQSLRPALVYTLPHTSLKIEQLHYCNKPYNKLLIVIGSLHVPVGG